MMLITALPDIMIPVEDILSLELFMLTFSFLNKLAKLQATLVRNYHLLTDGGEV